MDCGELNCENLNVLIKPVTFFATCMIAYDHFSHSLTWPMQHNEGKEVGVKETNHYVCDGIVNKYV